MQETFSAFLALRPNHANVKKLELIHDRNDQA
jgi:hypothetical protein